jgi:ferredoxin
MATNNTSKPMLAYDAKLQKSGDPFLWLYNKEIERIGEIEMIETTELCFYHQTRKSTGHIKVDSQNCHALIFLCGECVALCNQALNSQKIKHEEIVELFTLEHQIHERRKKRSGETKMTRICVSLKNKETGEKEYLSGGVKDLLFVPKDRYELTKEQQEYIFEAEQHEVPFMILHYPKELETQK